MLQLEGMKMKTGIVFERRDNVFEVVLGRQWKLIRLCC